MNTKFVVRGVLLALPVTVVALVVGLVLIVGRTPAGRPPDPTPLPPTILAPRGELPGGVVGLQEWAQYRGEGYVLAGSGFFLRLAEGQIVGVTTAHSVSLGNPERPVERIGLRVAGQADFVVEFDTLHGDPGQPRTGGDMTVDYVLMQTGQSIAPDPALVPDPRGAPQPGERVSLFSGVDGDRVLEGTVQSVNDVSVWVLMDESFNPSLMSGSPFVSQHTGQVVGMLIAVTPRRTRLLLGAHPIGSIVRLAESATEPILMADYRLPTATPVATQAAVLRATATALPSPTGTPMPTDRPTPTSTATPIPSPTSTPPPTPTPTPTETPSPVVADVLPAVGGGVHPEIAPAVLANYFPWYDPETWSTGCTSAGDQPRDGAYQSDDPTVIARHIEQAQAAGLDGFAVHWFAPGDRTDANLGQVLNQSPAGFNSTVTFLYHILPGVDRQGVIDALRYVLNGYSGHPRFFRAGGKPVILFSDMYRVPDASGAQSASAVAGWAEIRQAVDPDHHAWWIAEGLEPEYLSVFDGLYVYKIDHACCPNSYASAPRWAGWVRDWEQETGQARLWVGTVMPGWNDLNSAQAHCIDLRVGSDPFARDRADGAYYAQTWEAVLPTQPDFVVLHSFNEWVEGSFIEPSAQFGDLYLQLTAQWVARFKGGQ